MVGLVNSQVTYHKDIAPIIQLKCMPCHTTGGVGRMNLSDFEHVSSYASMIDYVINDGIMPPFLPDTSYARYKNERLVTQEEKELVQKWIRDGLKEGSKENLIPIEHDTKLKYDIRVCMQDSFEHYDIYYDQYQTFVLPLYNENDLKTESINFVPSNKKIVRSATIHAAPAGASKSRDAWDPRQGFYAYGSPVVTITHPALLHWMPDYHTEWTEKANFNIAENSELLLHIHYGPIGTVEKDKSCVELKVRDANNCSIIQSIPLVHPLLLDSFVLQPNNVTRQQTIVTLPENTVLHWIMPYFHLLCRKVEVFALLPDKSTLPLLKITDWDFHWKEKYYLENPISLPKGTKIFTTAAYDNTIDNPYNPASPPTTFRYGPYMFDENHMLLFGLSDPNEKNYILKPFDTTNSPLREIKLYIPKDGVYKLKIQNTLTKDISIVEEKYLRKGNQTIRKDFGIRDYGVYTVTLLKDQEVVDVWWIGYVPQI